MKSTDPWATGAKIPPSSAKATDLSVTPERLKFGDCEFDQRSGELWRKGDSVVLPNQLFRILALLIDRAGDLVSRDDLCHRLWPEGTFVDFEHSLNAGVRRLREAIGDSAATPRFIETVPQRGYRFIAHVEGRFAGAAEEVPVRRVSKVRVIAAIALTAMVSLLLGSRQQVSISDAGPTRRLVRLTSSSGLTTEPALSADGTLVAYASDRAGNDFDIYVQPVAGGDAVRLTNDPADDSEPSFSADGSQIVFCRRGSGLYVVGALGGQPRLLVPVAWARTPRFSPDGRSIAYWTGFPASVIAGGIPGALGSIFIVPSDGGAPHEIATRLASARYPIWSPDGKDLLFLGEEDSDRTTHDWYVIAKDGGTASKTGVVDALNAAGLRAPMPIPGAWSKEGRTIVFATNETDASNVWQIGISPSSHRVDRNPRRLTFGTAVERNPVIATSGRIAFASLVENVDIWRVPLDPRTGTAAGPAERITDDASSDTLRNVTSDGRRLFFISSRTKRAEVWMKDLQTGREHQLTYTGVVDASGSPDGSRVAFSTDNAGTRRIDIVGTDGTTPWTLCNPCDAPAGWSRDGKRLLYRTSGPSRIVLHDFASNHETELLRHSQWSLERARFTPDGSSVTFHTANSPNVRHIYTAPVDVNGLVSQQAWVPVVSDHGCHPSWSSNGALLYHFSSRDGAFCPWVQNVDRATERPTGLPRVVMHFHHPRLRATAGAQAFEDVEAGYLYMTLTESTGNIWMIDTEDE